MTPPSRFSRAVAALAVVVALAAAGRSTPADALPADDWTSNLTECVWTNGVTTSCALTMSSPVASMTISGTDTNTTYENLAGDESILARHFDSNRPSLNFTTDAIGGEIGSVSFKHYHNHSAGHAPNSYSVQIEFFDGTTNTWSSFGDPYVVENVGTWPIYPGPKTVNVPTPLSLQPNTSYSLRWQVTDNGTGFTNFTNGSFYGLTNLVMGFRKNQTISFTQAADSTVGSLVALSATSTSGLPPMFTSLTPLICTVSGTTATLVSPGDCSVKATVPGNAVWVAAPDQIMSFYVDVAPATTTTSTTSTTTPTPTSTTSPAVAASATTTTTATASAPSATSVPVAPVSSTPRQGQTGSSPVAISASGASTSTTTSSTPPDISSGTTVPTGPVPSAPASDSPAQIVPTGLDLAALGSAQPRLMQMSTTMQPGQSVAGSTLSLSPRGLAPASTVTVSLMPGNVVLARTVVDASGSATFDATLPPGLAAGTYSIIMTGETANNGPISSIIHFESNTGGQVMSVLPSYETVGPPPSAATVARALQAGFAPYDVVREIPTTAAITTTAVVLMGLVGASGLALAGAGGSAAGRRKSANRRSRRVSGTPEERDPTAGGRVDRAREDSPSGDPQPPSEGRDTESEGSFGSSDANLLGVTEATDQRWGDRLSPWLSVGYGRFDALLRSAIETLSPRSVLATRLVQDGTWMRAVAGTAELLVWVAGLVAGVAGALSVGSLAIAPSVGFVAVIAVMSLLNGIAGALAWLGFLAVVVSRGNITTIFDVRTMIGLAFVFFALPSIASAIRPLYDDGSRSIIHRVGDYVMMPVFLAYGAAGIYSAINGLSGLSIVQPDDATLLRNIVFVTAIARLGIEDVVRRGFPVRMVTVSIEATGEPGITAEIVKKVFGATLYTMAIVTFYGWGARTAAMIALVSLVPVLGLFADNFPNLVAVHKWFPRGILRAVIMIIVGTWYGRFILALADNPADTRSIAVFLLLPGVALGLI
ncbi:MAG: hypothetical protein RLZZ526_1228, partial [Actinomycetota bacterium]